MRHRTVAQHAIHRAANTLTGDDQTARYVAALVNDADTFLADPRSFLLSNLTMNVKCESATPTSHIEYHGIHTLALTSDGPVLTHHPHLGDVDLEGLLAAMGGPAPTCLLLAYAAITEGNVLPGHDDRFNGTGRSPLLAIRYLSAVRAWLTHDPDVDLPAMLPVLRAGITPDGWAVWALAGFTPEAASPFLARRIGPTMATGWLNAGMATHRGATLAAAGVHVDAVTALIANGLTKTVAQQWVTYVAGVTADQIRVLHEHGFHPSEADSALSTVGYDTALAYGAAGLITGRRCRGIGSTWWGNFAQHVDDAAAWATRTGLDASNAGWLSDIRNADLDDEVRDYGPDWVMDWVEHGVTTMEELGDLAPLSYHPCELDGAPRPVDPSGRPIRWAEAIWLWRATGENPDPWIAASVGTPEWDDNGAYLSTCANCPVDADGPTRCDHQVGSVSTDLPLITDSPHISDLFHCRSRQNLVEAMAEAADEGFPEHALEALASHGPVDATRWEYATTLVRLLSDDEFVPFLTSPSARPDLYEIVTGAEDAESHVTSWKAALAADSRVAA